MENKGEIIIYQSSDKQAHIEVRFEEDTVWLNQQQMAILFKQTKQNISLHINNLYKEKELLKKATVKESLTVQSEGKRKISRKTMLYNLDVIISVGYRVKSKQGTQFRMWATNTLKKHLIKGYTINRNLLQKQQGKLIELQESVELIKHSVSDKQISSEEAKGLLEIISTYTRSFILLNKFDNNTLGTGIQNEALTYEINEEQAVKAIEQLKKELIKKKEASNLFGKQKDESFKGILQSVVQTFGGAYLYPGIEEQAAHLLYFVIKNHPFTDGNKRIGAFMFIWFLEKNNHLRTKEGKIKINDNTLVALALLVAQSDPASKELMIKLIINLINE